MTTSCLKARMPFATLLATACLIAVAHTGCDSNTSDLAGSEIYIQIGDKVPPTAAYLTWTNYDCYPDGAEYEQAIYVWNGESVGQGHEGYKAVLRRMEQLKAGSRILVYPSCYMLWQSEGHNRMAEPPYSAFIGHLQDFVKGRGLTLVHSPYDHDGRLLPECVPPAQRGVTDEGS